MRQARGDYFHLAPSNLGGIVRHLGMVSFRLADSVSYPVIRAFAKLKRVRYLSRVEPKRIDPSWDPDRKRRYGH